jgi:cation diffusion facilitator CzcD-associated flavoprotein CzcO
MHSTNGHEARADKKKVAVIGGGPAGLVTAKYLVEAGLDPIVLERSDDLGGQWNPTNPASGIWPGMRTNTSRTTTAFSDFPPPSSYPMFPRAEQINQYLHAFADHFGVASRVRTRATVTGVGRAGHRWRVTWCDGGGATVVDNVDDFDHVVVASGRFTRPRMPAVPGLATIDDRVRVLHSGEYRSRDEFRGQRVLVLGNSISGLEIAAELAADDSIEVVSSARKPRYILQKVVRGVPSDWQWFTPFAGLLGRALPPDALGAGLREQVLAVAGDPASFGGLVPGDDILAAGLSQSQHYLAHVTEGRITARPGVRAINGTTVTFTDGTTTEVEAVICATGYELDLPYLDDEIREVAGVDDEHVELYQRTFHPDLPGLGFVGQYVLVGPYFPVLELQARWLAHVWSGRLALPSVDDMRAGVAEFAALKSIVPTDIHHALAGSLAAEIGVAPDVAARPELTRSLIFGPPVPARYLLDGPGASGAGEALYRDALAAFGPVIAEPLSEAQLAGLEMVAELLGDDQLRAAAEILRREQLVAV